MSDPVPVLTDEEQAMLSDSIDREDLPGLYPPMIAAVESILAARVAAAKAEAWDEGNEVRGNCRCGHSIFAHPKDLYRNCQPCLRDGTPCTDWQPPANPYGGTNE